MKLLPRHGPCWVCGPVEAGGLGFELWLRDDGKVETRGAMPVRAQGPPRHVHGGCLASVLDEVMGAAAWAAGHRVMAVHLAMDYRTAVPLGVEATFVGWVEEVSGRKVKTRASAMLPDGRTATEARGIFVPAPAEIVGALHDVWSPRS